LDVGKGITLIVLDVPSPMEPQGTSAYTLYFQKLVIGLHFAADNIGLR